MLGLSCAGPEPGRPSLGDELELVPLTAMSLFPASVAQAFALPCPGGYATGASLTAHLSQPDRLDPAAASGRPAPSASRPSASTDGRGASAATTAPPLGAVPSTQPLPRVPPWLGAFGGAPQLQQLQHAPLFQAGSYGSPNNNHPTTSGSSGHQQQPSFGPAFPMYVAYQQPGAPPPYASALPGVFGSAPFGHTFAQALGSVDHSGGNPSSSGAPVNVYGARSMGMGGGMSSGAVEGGHGHGGEDDLGDGTARAIKRARLVWTPQLHKRFEEAVNKLGPEKSIPKNIMQEMNVEGLTRENVASHLQKWRLQKKGSRDGDGETATTTTTNNNSHLDAATNA